MKSWEYGPLQAAENGRYLCNGSHPFFWLGDTAWQLLVKCSDEETELYLRNRAEKGFNVIQTVLVHTLDADEGNGRLPGRCRTDPAYWAHVSGVVEQAEKKGLYMGLLPAWGKLLRTGELNAQNAGRYAHFLGARFQKFPNIIWILGGDVRGSEAPETVRILARILKQYNPHRLMTYHPFGRTSSSLWFAQDDWLGLNMFQSGHRRYDQRSLKQWDDNAGSEVWFGEDNWRYVQRDHAIVNKPTLDGEPAYEGIRQGLHVADAPYWEAPDVRRYAYWSVFEGAAGHTYGHNAVMQFYSGGPAGAYGVRETWQQALHAEGAAQMGILRRLIESVAFSEALPRADRVTAGQGERYARVSVLEGESFLFCYSYTGRPFTLSLAGWPGGAGAITWYWMNPADGVCSFAGEIRAKENIAFQPPQRRCGANDWVLLLYAAEHGELIPPAVPDTAPTKECRPQS
jgi:hypothetical protein